MSCDIKLSKVCSTEAIPFIVADVTVCNTVCCSRWKGGLEHSEGRMVASWLAGELPD